MGQTLDLMQELDPAWTETYSQMAIDPWDDAALPAKELQLVALGLSASVTNLDANALRRHIRCRLTGGRIAAEILEVLKMAAILALHSMSLGAPMLIEEVRAAGTTLAGARDERRRRSRMKAIGQWNAAWDPFAELDPLWTDASSPPVRAFTPAAS